MRVFVQTTLKGLGSLTGSKAAKKAAGKQRETQHGFSGKIVLPDVLERAMGF